MTWKTKVFPNTFNKKPMFTVKKVDAAGVPAVEFCRETGAKKDKKPALNLGLAKCKYVLEHLDELKQFVADNS